MDVETQKRLQTKADVATSVCAISYLILVFLIANQPSGAAALYLMIPIFVVIILHLSLGLTAVAMAIRTRRVRRNLWVYGYFLGALLFTSWQTGLMAGLMGSARAWWERVENAQETALYRAIEHNRLAEVKQLLREGADLSHCFVNDRDFRQHSPLQLALSKQLPELAAVLLRGGANPDHVCGDQVVSPVMLAAQYQDIASLTALIEHGVDTNPRNPAYSTLVMAMIGGNYSMPYAGHEATRLRERIDVGLANQVVEILLSAGADANGPQGENLPLHWAVLLGDVQLVKQLLAAGADPNLAGRFRRTPTTLSIEFLVPDVTQLLLGETPGLDLSGYAGFSALAAAAKTGNRDTIELLLQLGVDLAPMNDPSEEPSTTGRRGVDLADEMSRALRDGDDLLFQTLARAGADVNRPNPRQQGRLLIGLYSQQPEKLKMLLAAGADVNGRNRAGGTALHYYASCTRCSNPIAAMQALVANGADVNALNSQGRTPLRLARVKRIRDTIDFLESVGALETVDDSDE